MYQLRMAALISRRFVAQVAAMATPSESKPVSVALKEVVSRMDAAKAKSAAQQKVEAVDCGPRARQLLRLGAPLPHNCPPSPTYHYWLSSAPGGRELVDLLQQNKNFMDPELV